MTILNDPNRAATGVAGHQDGRPGNPPAGAAPPATASPVEAPSYDAFSGSPLERSTDGPAGPGAKPAKRVRAGRVTLVMLVLVIPLLAGSVVSGMVGQLPLKPTEVIGSILNKVGIHWLAGPTHEFGDAALWDVRFPRIVMVLFVGACLGVAGAMMQGVFGNPLAEPGTIGVSSGAAVGASFSILYGPNFLGGFTTPLLAFAGGMLTTFVVYLLSRSNGRTEVVTLILTGVAVNAVTGALISFIVFKAPTQAREQIVFWQMGSFNGSRWEQVAFVVPIAVVGLVLVMFTARGMDLLSLGEKAARHLGVNVELLRICAMVLVAVLVSAAVAFVGIISFVGLVVPHLMRIILGPGHKVLLPASMLGGAVLLTIADLLARTLVEFADLPIGMLTSLIGGPYFFYLLRRSRREQGGWA